MIILPTEKVKPPDIIEPPRLFLYSQPKVGKTSLLAALPNCLIIDLEDGSSSFEAASINVRKIAQEQFGGNMLAALSEVKKAIVEMNTKAGKRFYDFIAIDTTSALEKMAIDLANSDYRKSNIGKKFEGGNILTELEYGGGYGWYRDSFTKLYNSFMSLANKSLILSGHVKSSSINKGGKDVNVKDIDLIGKAKQIVCSDADAIGWLYRGKDYENILSFVTNENDLATGARAKHLRNREFVISKMFELDGVTPFTYDKTNIKKDGIVKTYWEHIYPSIKK
jgi:hypothetical protein